MRSFSLLHENDISSSKDDQDGKKMIGSMEVQRGLHLKQGSFKGMSISLPPFPASRSTQAGCQGDLLLYYIL